MLARIQKFVLPHRSWAVNESRISIFFGRIFATISMILACIWCLKKNTEDRFLGGITFMMQGNKIFNLHPMCMIISMTFCMAMSITAFRDGYSFKVAKYIHINFNLLAKAFMIVGLRAAYIDHDEPEGKGSEYHYRHFGSMHSWLGLATSCLLFQQDFFGGLNFLYPKLFRVPHYFSRAYRQYHVFFGKCAYIVGAVTILTGIAVKNEFLRCSSSVNQIDRNPLDGYNLIPPGCKISQGLGLCVLLSMVFVLLGLRNPISRHSTDRDSLLSDIGVPKVEMKASV